MGPAPGEVIMDVSIGRTAELPPSRAHFGTNGDVLYEIEIDLGDGRRGVFKWRQPWPRPEFLGLFERSKPGVEKLIPHGQRGAFKKQRERAREVVTRASLGHPWRRYVAQVSPCVVHPYNVRCLSDRHALPLPTGLKTTGRKRKVKRRT